MFPQATFAPIYFTRYIFYQPDADDVLDPQGINARGH